MWTRTRKKLPTGELCLNGCGHILIALVLGDLSVVVDIGKRLRVCECALEGLSTHGNQSAAKIRKTVISATTADDRCGGPELPTVSSVLALVEVGMERAHLVQRQSAQLCVQQFTLFVHVATG